MKKKNINKRIKKIVDKFTKKKLILAIVALLVVAYFLFKPKKDVLQDWEEIWGVSPESNPDDLSFEEWNELQPEIYRQEPGMLEYLRDCPFFKASTKDPDSMDIFIDETSCDRKTHVETGAIIIQNYDFEKGVQEFKAWLKKNKLKLGKDVIVEDFYPWDYEEVCRSGKGGFTDVPDGLDCLKEVKLDCIKNSDNTMKEVVTFIIFKNQNKENCQKEIKQHFTGSGYKFVLEE